jgi:uncharacterized oligopeptide transporter (OPT) family protein
MGSRLGPARDFLTLTLGLALLLIPVCAWLLGLDTGSPRMAAGIAGCAATLAALGLFMTWGDGGSRLRNAARTLAVLLALCSGVVLLLLWGTSTAPAPT